MELNEIVNALQGKTNKKDKLLGAFNDLLANFEGPEGPQGIPGEKGEPGYTPIKGVDYFDGEDGKIGKVGPAGKSIKGEPGKAGKDGKDGIEIKPKEIVEKLNTLKNVLEVKVLKGYKDLFTNDSFKEFKNQVYTKGQIDQRWHGGGASNFIQLHDVPSSYIGYAGYVVTVNATEDGLIFTQNQSTDEKVKISTNDTTAGYLYDKMTLGGEYKISQDFAKYNYYAHRVFESKNLSSRRVKYFQFQALLKFYLHPWRWGYISKHLVSFAGFKKLLRKVKRSI